MVPQTPSVLESGHLYHNRTIIFDTWHRSCREYVPLTLPICSFRLSRSMFSYLSVESCMTFCVSLTSFCSSISSSLIPFKSSDIGPPESGRKKEKHICQWSKHHLWSLFNQMKHTRRYLLITPMMSMISTEQSSGDFHSLSWSNQATTIQPQSIRPPNLPMIFFSIYILYQSMYPIYLIYFIFFKICMCLLFCKMNLQIL